MSLNDAVHLDAWINDKDADAFRGLVQEYANLVYAAALRILKNPADAEDIAQESFQRLAMAEQSPGAYLGPWLHRVTTNLALNRIRNEQRRREREQRFQAAQPTHTEMNWDDLYDYVDEAIAALPEELRVPIVAHYLDGHSKTEIANAQGIPRTTLNNRIEKGLKEIRRHLKRKGVLVAAAVLATVLTENTAAAAPATLLTTLGKIALAGTMTVPVGTVTAAAGTSGMSMLAKTGLAILTVAVMTTGGLVWRFAGNSTEATPEDPERIELPLEEPQHISIPPATAASDEMLASATREEAPMPPGVISGRVYDVESGLGLAGVEIRCTRHNPQSGVKEHDATVNTLSGGYYTFVGLETGSYRIRCASSWETRAYGDKHPYNVRLWFRNREQQQCQVGESEASDSVDFQVFLQTTLAGIVRDSQGNPVADARISLFADDTSLYTRSNADGSFKLGGVPENSVVYLRARKGESSVRPNPNGGAEEKYTYPDKDALSSGVEGPFPVPEEGLSGLEVTVQQGAFIAGMLYDPKGKPLPDTHIMVRNPESNTSTAFLAACMGSTDANGYFEMAGIPEGRYEFAWEPRNPNEKEQHYGWTVGRAITLGELSLKRGETRSGLRYKTVETVFDHEEQIQLSGRVTDVRGDGIEGAAISIRMIERQGRGPIHWDVKSDQQGRFKCEVGACRGYVIHVRHPEYSTYYSGNVPPEDLPLAITLEDTGSVSGLVVEKTTGSPVSRYDITIGGQRGQRVNDAEGKFHFEQSDVGEVTLTVKAEGYSDKQQRVQVAPNAETKNVHIELDPPWLIHGRVTTEKGNPVKGAQILDRSTSNRVEERLRYTLATTDEDGRFTANFTAVWRPATLYAYHSNYPMEKVTVLEGEEEVHIILCAETGAIRGQVTVPEGVTVPPNLYMSTPDARELMFKTRQVAAPDGSFHFPKVPPGDYYLYAAVNSDPPFGSIQKRIQVYPNQTTECNYDFTRHQSALEGSITYNGRPPTDYPNFKDRFVGSLRTASDGREFNHLIEVDDTGMFRVDNLVAGEAVASFQIPVAPGWYVMRNAPLRIPEQGMVQDAFSFKDDNAQVMATVRNNPVDFLPQLELYTGHLSFEDATTQTLAAVWDQRVAVNYISTSKTWAFPPVEAGAYTALARIYVRGIWHFGYAHCTVGPDEQVAVEISLN